MKSLILAASMTLCGAPEQPITWPDALAAIRQVETGGCAREGRGATGDYRTINGKRVPMAHGPFQVWSVYHQDAAERDKSLTSYSRCKDSMEYSRRVVAAYMKRYARAPYDRLVAGKGTLGDLEVVARIHNGGPRGASTRRKATDSYWSRVSEIYRRTN
jgi:hypothetical protein